MLIVEAIFNKSVMIINNWVCSGSCRNLFFRIINFDGVGCNTVTEFNEGVEFALRLDDEEVWIPLAVIFHNSGHSNGITLGNLTNLVIRGYSLDPRNEILGDKSVQNVNVSLELCDFEREPESIQFRWLQTSRFVGRNELRDLWGLDDLWISYVEESGEERVLLSDSFDSEELK